MIADQLCVGMASGNGECEWRVEEALVSKTETKDYNTQYTQFKEKRGIELATSNFLCWHVTCDW